MITRGSGTGVVVATGMNTAMGQIANMLQNAEQNGNATAKKVRTARKNINYCSSYFDSASCIGWCVSRNEVYHMFLAGVSLAVAAIPEGLPAIVTVALSLGVQRMIKREQL